MATYASIRYKFSGANVSGVLQASKNLSDVCTAATGRTRAGSAAGFGAVGSEPANTSAAV